MELSPDFAQQALRAKNPHLAIEALRDLLTEEAGHVARANLVRQRAFSQRLTELMTKYTNQQLTSAEVIAALIEMAKEIAAERDRGKAFAPPLDRRPAGVLRRVVGEAVGGRGHDRRRAREDRP